MTYNDLLIMLRTGQPDTTKSQLPRSEPDELHIRLTLFELKNPNKLIAEWSPQELAVMFIKQKKNLNANIPCKHCGGKKDSRT